MLKAIGTILGCVLAGVSVPLLGALVWHYVLMPVVSPPEAGQGIDGVVPRRLGALCSEHDDARLHERHCGHD